MAMANATGGNDPTYIYADDGKVYIGNSQVSRRIDNALIKNWSVRHESLDVSSFDGGPSVMPGETVMEIELVLMTDDVAGNEKAVKELRSSPEASQVPQERAKARGRLEVPPEDERPARKLRRR